MLTQKDQISLEKSSKQIIICDHRTVGGKWLPGNGINYLQLRGGVKHLHMIYRQDLYSRG